MLSRSRSLPRYAAQLATIMLPVGVSLFKQGREEMEAGSPGGLTKVAMGSVVIFGSFQLVAENEKMQSAAQMHERIANTIESFAQHMAPDAFGGAEHDGAGDVCDVCDATTPPADNATTPPADNAATTPADNAATTPPATTPPATTPPGARISSVGPPAARRDAATPPATTPPLAVPRGPKLF